MIRRNRLILGTYLMLTLLLVLLGLYLKNLKMLWILRYLVFLSLPLTALAARGRHPGSSSLVFALLCAALGDAFIYLPLGLERFEPNLPLGMLFFALSYTLITAVYVKGGLSSMVSGLKVHPDLLIFPLFLATMEFAFWGTLPLLFLLLGFFFFVALSTAFWASVRLYSRRSYPKRIRNLVLLSTTLMVLCDLIVVLGFLLPVMSARMYDIGSVIVWSAYIPAWTILAILSTDEGFHETISW